MDINNVFYKKLFDRELYSFEDYGGEYILKVSNYVSEKSLADSSKIDNSELVFSESLAQNLKLIYDQVLRISLNWGISEEFTDKIIDENEWLKRYRENNDLSYDFIKDQLSGIINITSLDEMFDDKKYNYLTINGVRYLPFDHHNSLIAYFKLESNKIEDNIYLFNTEDSGKIHNMKVDCIKYLELAYEAKLFYYWQYAYIFKDGVYNERLNKTLPLIFPFVELDLLNFN